MTDCLLLCHPDYEVYARREAAALSMTPRGQGRGWVRVHADAEEIPGDLCFAHAALIDPVEIRMDGARGMAEALAQQFLESARGERFVKPWPVRFDCADREKLSRRTAAVEASWRDMVRARMSRVMKLAVSPDVPSREPCRGFFVWLADFGHAFAACTRVDYGQRRMRDDPAAPSRSFLKVEEAYTVLGQRPGAADRVVDLGAAPGGWSYSAARNGAFVTAVDNGQLKGAAHANPLIEPTARDAFSYCPTGDGRRTWLFCDMVEHPDRVLPLIMRWLSNGWCSRFIVNLKFGATDPIELLARVMDPENGPGRFCTRLIVRHLYHDREEFTLMGAVRGSGGGDRSD